MREYKEQRILRKVMYNPLILFRNNIILFLLVAFVQCNNKVINEKQYDSKSYFSEKVKEISKNFSLYYNYRYKNIKLSSEFNGIDSFFKPTDKISFFRLLLTGEFMPVKIDSLPTYMLLKIPPHTDSSIIRDIKDYTEETLFYIGLRGKAIPKFNFKDINGNLYSNASFDGKIVVIKCWYMACVACVKEIPELNKLVEQNKPYKDNIAFISFAFDSKESLNYFLAKRRFNYLVFPDTKNYISDSLHVHMYPTHILLDKKGKIVTYVNDVHDLKLELEKLKAQVK